MLGHTPEGELFTTIVLKTFKLNGLLTQIGDVMCAEFGVTSARWKVLGALVASAGRPMTVPQIARSMGQTRQAVQRIANEMVEAGFLSWQENPDHKRAKLLTITEQGQEVFRNLWERQVPWANELSMKVSFYDLQIAGEVLSKLIIALEKDKNQSSL